MLKDVELAWRIVNTRARWIGPEGQLHANIAAAVTEGIALGRNVAADIVQAELEAAEKELTDKLSASARERTEVRRNTANAILKKIKSLN